MIRYLLGLLAICAHFPGLAQTEDEEHPTYRKFSTGWVVKIVDSTCMAGRPYDNGDMLIVAYYVESDTAAVSVSIPAATSLEEGQEVSLYIKFVAGKNLDEGWGQNKFKVRKSDGTSQLIGSFSGRDMLRDLGRYELVGFTLDNESKRIVGSYNLDGSAHAMSALQECSIKLAGLNPDDPFLR